MLLPDNFFKKERPFWDIVDTQNGLAVYQWGQTPLVQLLPIITRVVTPSR